VDKNLNADGVILPETFRVKQREAGEKLEGFQWFGRYFNGSSWRDPSVPRIIDHWKRSQRGCAVWIGFTHGFQQLVQFGFPEDRPRDSVGILGRQVITKQVFKGIMAQQGLSISSSISARIFAERFNELESGIRERSLTLRVGDCIQPTFMLSVIASDAAERLTTYKAVDKT
jgi:hypothetical protein